MAISRLPKHITLLHAALAAPLDEFREKNKKENKKEIPDNLKLNQEAFNLFCMLQGKFNSTPTCFRTNEYDALFAEQKDSKQSPVQAQLETKIENQPLLKTVAHLFRIARSLDYLEQLEEDFVKPLAKIQNKQYTKDLQLFAANFKKNLENSLPEEFEQFQQKVSNFHINESKQLDEKSLPKVLDAVYKQHQSYLSIEDEIKAFEAELQRADPTKAQILEQRKLQFMTRLQEFRNTLKSFSEADSKSPEFSVLAPFDQIPELRSIQEELNTFRQKINLHKQKIPNESALDELPIIKVNPGQNNIDICLKVLSQNLDAETMDLKTVEAAIHTQRATMAVLTSWITVFIPPISNWVYEVPTWVKLHNVAKEIFSIWVKLSDPTSKISERIEAIKSSREKLAKINLGDESDESKARNKAHDDLYNFLSSHRRAVSELETKVISTYTKLCRDINEHVRAYFNKKYHNKKNWTALISKFDKLHKRCEKINIENALQKQAKKSRVTEVKIDIVPEIRYAPAKWIALQKENDKLAGRGLISIGGGIAAAVFGGPLGWFLGGGLILSGVLDLVKLVKNKFSMKKLLAPQVVEKTQVSPSDETHVRVKKTLRRTRPIKAPPRKGKALLELDAPTSSDLSMLASNHSAQFKQTQRGAAALSLDELKDDDFSRRPRRSSSNG